MNIAFPFGMNPLGRTEEVGHPAHVRQMIELLLFTRPGERVNRPEFGSGLMHLVFAPNSPELAAALQYTTQAALQRYLGDVIEVQALEVTSEEAKLTVFLRYALKSTGEVREETFLQGGTP